MIMKEMGLDAYRFSISWSRILPCMIVNHTSFLSSNYPLVCFAISLLFLTIGSTDYWPDGKLKKGVNQKGVAYYHNLIDELLANGAD